LTDQEKLAAWGPFVAHAGRYELKDNVLSMRPVVAKNPAVMAANGGEGTADIKFDGGSTVYMTAKNPQGATLKLRRLE